MKNLLTGLVFFGLAAGPFAAMAQSNTDQSKFKQLQQELPTPNTYRSASGAPGHQYWQQRADYNIKVELNDENQSITGSETITYTNNSPDVLTYVWLQLDQNIFEPNSMANATRTGNLDQKMSLQAVEYMAREKFDGGFKIKAVKDRNGKALKYTINNTMMRVDLPSDLKPKQSFYLQHRLVQQHQRSESIGWPFRLRVLPGRWQLPVRNGTVVPAYGSL